MRTTLSLVAGLMLFGQPTVRLFAEPMPGEHGQKWEERRTERTEKMLEKMTKDLNLSADQQKTIKAAFDDRNLKMNALQAEMGEKAKAIHEETQSKINASLNDDQKKKYAEMKKEYKEEVKGRRKERLGHKDK